jgi:hypothetical protein
VQVVPLYIPSSNIDSTFSSHHTTSEINTKRGICQESLQILKEANSLIKSYWLDLNRKPFVEKLYSLAFVTNIEVWKK